MRLGDYLENIIIDNIEFTINIMVMTGKQSILGKFEGTTITIDIDNTVPTTIDPHKLLSKEVLDEEIVFIKILKDELRFYIKGASFKTGFILGE